MVVKSVFAVAVGGAVGSVFRYVISTFLLPSSGGGWPWGTFTINIAGALVLGFLVRYFTPQYASSPLALALTVGLCGGFTTFSTFTSEMFALLERGAIGRGALYAVGSVVLGYGGFVVGHIVARMLRPLA